MAALEYRNNGSWRAKVRRRGAPSLSFTHPEREVVERWASDVEAAIRAGRLDEFLSARATASTTLGDVLDLYAEAVTPGKKSAASERSRIRALRSSRLGRLALANLTRREVRNYRDGKAGVGVNRDLALLSVVLKWARAERDLDVDPEIVRGLKRPESKARERRLNPGELERLLEHAPKIAPWLASAITLLTESGLRRGELCALRWHDIDLPRCTATLAATKNGDTGVRVPLSTRAREALKALPRGIADAPVIGVHADTMSHAFSQCCGLAEITGLRLHDLRAEAVSRLFERGLTLPEVRAISRHKSTAILRYVRGGDVERLVAKLG